MLGIDDAALAILGAGLISTAGSLYTNRNNLRYQANVNDINWQIAAQNNATQIEMANTAHQREVADLRAAGLNPILSAGGSGAATPSLSTIRGDAAQIENPVEGFASSARSLSRYLSQSYQADIASKKAGTAETRANIDLVKANASIARSEAKSAHYQAELDRMKAYYARDQYDLDYLNTKLEHEALKDLTVGDLPSGRRVIIKGDYYKNFKEGLMSDAKLRANQNWRANLSSFVPFVSPAAINSGASAARTFRRFTK